MAKVKTETVPPVKTKITIKQGKLINMAKQTTEVQQPIRTTTTKGDKK